MVDAVDEFAPFDHSRYRELSEVPHAHIDYLRRTTRAGKRPLAFVHIPHVLVAATSGAACSSPLPDSARG